MTMKSEGFKYDWCTSRSLQSHCWQQILQSTFYGNHSHAPAAGYEPDLTVGVKL